MLKTLRVDCHVRRPRCEDHLQRRKGITDSLAENLLVSTLECVVQGREASERSALGRGNFRSGEFPDLWVCAGAQLPAASLLQQLPWRGVW